MPDLAFTGSTSVNGRYVAAYSIAENAGTPALAKVLLRDGSSSGTILAAISLAASTSAAFAYPTPLYFPSGVIFVQVSTGTARGDITYT